MKLSAISVGAGGAALLLSIALWNVTWSEQQAEGTQSTAAEGTRSLIAQYCLDCHNSSDKLAGLDLEAMCAADLKAHADQWEQVVRKLRVRQMPPADVPGPNAAEYDAATQALEQSLDQLAASEHRPGRTPTFRRLTRREYQNAIRDLLELNIDVTALLPADESSHGFDNVTVGDLSPTLLERYITAAQKISRLAVGTPSAKPAGDTFRVRADITQEQHVEGLPLGTRGGTLIPYHFPNSGEYEIQIRLARDRNEEVEGLSEAHQIDVLLDRNCVQSFTVQPPGPDRNFALVDAHLRARIPVTAGPHQLGVTFLKNPSSLLETKRQPYQAHYNTHRHPRISPAIYEVSIVGPFTTTAAPDTPSRRRIFVRLPQQATDEDTCAREILAQLLRRAYRRPVTEADFKKPLELFRQARAEAGFEAGIELALSGILVNPNFLFRIERDPPGIAGRTAYQLSPLELASRLSFFLWSSIPDDQLLELAASGELSQPEVYEQQVRRMLADPRSRSLVENFADQWLHLRNLDSITPDLRLFPDFDDNLRQAFRRESELLFEQVLREDQSVLQLLTTQEAFLNERLAKHYDIPHVYGTRFRRVSLDGNSMRGGLLRQGSILLVTSYATRTSPVIRGKWILENILGAPPPPPPGNVPALKDNTVSSMLSVRERLAEHRANEQCASCHELMDPVGFALENFDAVGRWRTLEEGKPIDAAGSLAGGSQFTGVSGLEQAILARPEIFVSTLTEKLLTYALGRGTEPADGPAVRTIVRQAKANDYRLSSIILAIADSEPFQMRMSE